MDASDPGRAEDFNLLVVLAPLPCFSSPFTATCGVGLIRPDATLLVVACCTVLTLFSARMQTLELLGMYMPFRMALTSRYSSLDISCLAILQLYS